MAAPVASSMSSVSKEAAPFILDRVRRSFKRSDFHISSLCNNLAWLRDSDYLYSDNDRRNILHAIERSDLILLSLTNWMNDLQDVRDELVSHTNKLKTTLKLSYEADELEKKYDASKYKIGDDGHIVRKENNNNGNHGGDDVSMDDNSK